MEALPECRFERTPPRALAGDDERQFVDQFVRRRVGHERARTGIDRGPQAVERGAIAEDVEMDPNLRRLVETRRVERDRGWSEDVVVAAGITGDGVLEQDPAPAELDGDAREVGGRRPPAATRTRSRRRRRRARPGRRPADGRGTSSRRLPPLRVERRGRYHAAVGRSSSPLTSTVLLRTRGRWLAAMLVAVWLLAASLVPAASAADGDPISVFDEPIVDVAIVERGANLSPDLLTLDTSGEVFGGVRVSLLRREVGWSRVASTTVDLSIAARGTTPWLVQLGDGRFAVVATSSDAPRTYVAPLFVDPTSTIPFRIGTAVILEMTASDTGAADVVGDAASAASELIVAGNRDGDLYSCAGATIEVLGGDDLAVKDTFEVPKLRLAGASLGEWDGRPGADLLAHAYEPCPIIPDSGEHHHFLGIRLRDGSRIVDIPAPEGDPTNFWPSLPLVVDVDGDGRDEAVVRTNSTIFIVDPVDRWRFTTLAEGSLAPLVATRSPGSTSGTVTWLGRAGELGPVGVMQKSVRRVNGSLTAGEVTTHMLSAVPPGEDDGLLARLQNAEQNQQPPLAWTWDLDGDGCSEVLTTLVQAACLGADAVSPGPLWLGTRPLGVVGPPEDRRLLAAVGFDWYPYLGGPVVPAPAAADVPGAWRHPPSITFALVELPLPTGSDASVPVVAPQIDPIVSSDGKIDLTGPTGSRLLVRITALAASDDATSPGPLSTRIGFLATDGREFEFAGLIPIPVPAGTTPGASPGSEPFDIRGSVTDSTGTLADRWMVVAATLDARGNVSEPVATAAIYDVTAPTVSLGVPFLSAPWPFDGVVAGTSEPGMTVRLGDGPPVTVDADGSFKIRTRLAPWPQTLAVTAVDRSGNATTTSVSVMGGVDLRHCRGRLSPRSRSSSRSP